MLYKNIISKDLQTLNIFSLDGKLKSALITFAFCCQIISGFTEWLGIAPFLIDLLKPFLSATLSNWVGNGIAISLAFFLEFLVFYLVGFIVHAIKQKYWSEGEEIDLIFNKIKFGSACTLLVCLILVSMFLSKRNVRYQVASTNFKTEEIDLDKFDSKKKEQIATIETRYLADKGDLDQSLKDSKELTARAYTAKIDALNGEINILKRKEQRTGKSYRTAKLNHNKEIAGFRTQQAEELKELRQKYDQQLATLKHNRSNDIYAIADAIESDKTKATTKEDNSAAATAERNDWISFVLQWLASLAVLGFVVARSWVEMSNATAGIKEKALPLQEQRGSNFWDELFLLGRLKIQRKLQNGIRKKLAAIPDLVKIEDKGAVLSLSELTEHQMNAIEINKRHGMPDNWNTGISDDAYLNLFSDESIKPSANKNNGEIITATVEMETTSSEDSKLRAHNVSNDLSFNENSHQEPTVKSGQIVGEKNCLNCGKTFQYKNKKKKYCSDACRIKFWEKKTNQKFGRNRNNKL